MLRVACLVTLALNFGGGVQGQTESGSWGDANSCSGGNPGYNNVVVSNPSGTTVEELGSLSCATGFHGTATVSCANDGGTFSFSGCSANVCQAPGSSPLGYNVPNPSGTTLSSIGVVSCAPGYSGTASVSCTHASSPNPFQITGCTENTCVANSGTPGGVVVATPNATTVSGLNVSSTCAAGYTSTGAGPAAWCSQNGADFAYIGCGDVDECAADTDGCNDSQMGCVNTVGSYYCECFDGWGNDGAVTGTTGFTGQCPVNDYYCHGDNAACWDPINSVYVDNLSDQTNCTTNTFNIWTNWLPMHGQSNCTSSVGIWTMCTNHTSCTANPPIDCVGAYSEYGPCYNVDGAGSQVCKCECENYNADTGYGGKHTKTYTITTPARNSVAGTTNGEAAPCSEGGVTLVTGNTSTEACQQYENEVETGNTFFAAHCVVRANDAASCNSGDNTAYDSGAGHCVRTIATTKESCENPHPLLCASAVMNPSSGYTSTNLAACNALPGCHHTDVQGGVDTCLPDGTWYDNACNTTSGGDACDLMTAGETESNNRTTCQNAPGCAYYESTSTTENLCLTIGERECEHKLVSVTAGQTGIVADTGTTPGLFGANKLFNINDTITVTTGGQVRIITDIANDWSATVDVAWTKSDSYAVFSVGTGACPGRVRSNSMTATLGSRLKSELATNTGVRDANAITVQNSRQSTYDYSAQVGQALDNEIQAMAYTQGNLTAARASAMDTLNTTRNRVAADRASTTAAAELNRDETRSRYMTKMVENNAESERVEELRAHQLEQHASDTNMFAGQRSLFANAFEAQADALATTPGMASVVQEVTNSRNFVSQAGYTTAIDSVPQCASYHNDSTGCNDEDGCNFFTSAPTGFTWASSTCKNDAGQTTGDSSSEDACEHTGNTWDADANCVVAAPGVAPSCGLCTTPNGTEVTTANTQSQCEKTGLTYTASTCVGSAGALVCFDGLQANGAACSQQTCTEETNVCVPMVTACADVDLSGTTSQSQSACTAINPPGASSPGCTYRADDSSTSADEELCFYASDAG